MYYYRTFYPFFAIQSEYFTVYQCFLTHRSLYLVVWNVADGEQGLRDLQPWLENIEVTYMSSILYHIKYFPSADDTSTAPQHLVCRVVQSLHSMSICKRPHMDTSMILICVWLVCRLCTTLHMWRSVPVTHNPVVALLELPALVSPGQSSRITGHCNRNPRRFCCPWEWCLRGA